MIIKICTNFEPFWQQVRISKWQTKNREINNMDYNYQTYQYEATERQDKARQQEIARQNKQEKATRHAR